MTHLVLSSIFTFFPPNVPANSDQGNRKAVRTDFPYYAERNLQFQHDPRSGQDLEWWISTPLKDPGGPRAQLPPPQRLRASQCAVYR